MLQDVSDAWLLGALPRLPRAPERGGHGDIPGQDTAGGLCSLWLTVPSIWPPLALMLGLAVGMGLWECAGGGGVLLILALVLGDQGICAR